MEPLQVSQSEQFLADRLHEAFLRFCAYLGITQGTTAAETVDILTNAMSLIRSGVSCALEVARSEARHILVDDVMLFVMDTADGDGDGVLSYKKFQAFVQ